MGTPLFNRRRVGNAWTYDDPEENNAAVQIVLFVGFDLSNFDDWLEQTRDTWRPADLARVLEQRAGLLQACREYNDEAVRAWVQYFHALRFMNEREEFLHPYALLGKQVQHRLPPAGTSKTVYMPKQRSATAIRSRADRIMAATRAGDSIKKIASDEGVSPSTVSRVRRTHKP